MGSTARYWQAPLADNITPNYQISVKHGYFLNQDIGHFDAPFFSTTAKEAAAMDPMKRLLLEVSYESIESGKAESTSQVKTLDY